MASQDNDIVLEEDHSSVVSSVKNSRVKKYQSCKFYYKFGNCRYGEECQFLHDKGYERTNLPGIKNLDVIGDDACVSQISDIRSSVNKQYFSKGHSQYFEGSTHKNRDEFQYCPRHDKGNFSKYMPYNSRRNKISSSKFTSSKYSVPVCNYFKRGFCHNGDNCKFYHPIQNSHLNIFRTNATSKKQTKNSEGESMQINILEMECAQEMHDNKLQENICEKKNFNDVNEAESTRNMKKELFFQDVGDKEKVQEHSSKMKFQENMLEMNKGQHTWNPSNHKHNYDLASLKKEDFDDLRNTEIMQLKKRFPNHKVLDESRIEFEFQPSDPDWSFDIKILQLQVEFPEDYPKEACKIIIQDGNDHIPLILQRFLITKVAEWILQKHQETETNGKTELVFRPFLKWFDRNLENLFIQGLRKVKQDVMAKASGIEFVPVENLFPATTNSIADPADDKKPENETLQSSVESQTAVKLKSESQPESSAINNCNKKLSNLHLPESNGFKIVLTNVELIEGAGTLKCTKISLTLRCNRCKKSCDATTVLKKDNQHRCLKCSKIIGFVFQPSIFHQFSSVLGFLHLINGQIVDMNLTECVFLVDCLNCSKQTVIDGMHYGQKFASWCNFCNQKILICIEGAKFQASTPSSFEVKNVSAKKAKKNQDPVIQVGEPLPQYGTCKHYKKSYRWLRFPCCGKIYPCDVCHDENQKDHEMKFASRMICGYCSKEQPYGKDKQCIACSANVTKKANAHWEGGKGCRNKIQMCRDDKQKYLGVNKTVSRRAQSLKKS